MLKLNSFKIIFGLFIFLPAQPVFAGMERVDADIALYDDEAARMTNEFNKIPVDISDKEWVNKKLAHMFDIDQYTRQFADTPFKNNYSEDEKQYFSRVFGGERWLKVDRKNTEDLKELLKKYEWFKISEFGIKADRDAWLLTQHADLDIQFQRQVLSILEGLWPKGETSPTNYAYLFDRVAASFHDPSQRTLQRYGTQGQCVGPGQWEPIPIEDPENIDVRRATIGLPPMSEYKELFKNICH